MMWYKIPDIHVLCFDHSYCQKVVVIIPGWFHVFTCIQDHDTYIQCTLRYSYDFIPLGVIGRVKDGLSTHVKKS
jgi:hypothetical protein